jgi:hypothetical protein
VLRTERIAYLRMGGDCRAAGFQSGFCRAEGSDILFAW